MNDKPYPYTPEQEAWLRDLETTTEPQTVGYLHRTTDPIGYCCLGRACVILGIEEDDHSVNDDGVSYEGDSGYLPRVAVARLLVTDKAQEDLIGMNDGGKSFKEIAAAIRANPRKFFEDI